MSPTAVDTTMNDPFKTQKYYALTIFGYKKEGMSEEDYHNYISKTHAGHLKALLAKNDIISYTMQHNTTALNAPGISRVYNGMLPLDKVSDCDAIIQMAFRDLDDYLRVREDEHFIKVVNPDHKNFADGARTRFSMGWFERHVVDGQVVS